MNSLPKIPRGWAWASLGDVLDEIEGGRSFKCRETPPEDGEVGVLKVSAVTWGKYDESESKTCVDPARVEPRFFVQPGDLLFSRANTIELVGRAVIVRSVTKQLMLSDKILRLRLKDEGAHSAWLLYALSAPFGRDEIQRLSTGNQESMRNIGQDRIRQIRVPIAPRNEQVRIIDEVEKQFTRLDAGVTALLRVQAQLKRYRASVLKAACEGSLVPTEAELARREKRDYEPADKLLARILKERRAHWEADQLAKMKAAGKPPKDDSWRAKYAEPFAANTAGKNTLPEGWCWVRWEQVGFSQNGRPFPSSEYGEFGVRLLRPGNLHASGQVRWTEANTKCLPTRFETENHDLLVGGNELVMNLTAQSLKDEFLGRICLTSDGEKCLLNQRLARLTPVLLHKRFCLWLFKAWGFRRLVDGLNKGSLIQHMFTSQLADFVFALPPAAEQARIAAELDTRLSMSEFANSVVDASLVRSVGLRSAVLRHAFDGELVPQDPSEEPATKLLEQIAAGAPSALQAETVRTRLGTAGSRKRATR